MTLEHHRDLAHEFPELKQRVHDLKLESAEFRHLYLEYQELDNEIHRIEQDIETPSDAYTEQLKWRRAHLKDRLYGLLTGRLHPAPDTEEYVVRGKFRVPVDHGEVSRDWHGRGYASEWAALAAGAAETVRSRSRETLLAVLTGPLEVALQGVDYHLAPGDELFVPRGVPLVLRNPLGAEVAYLVGRD